MKISKRLKSLAGLIILDDKVADIGCDHALLDIYMVKNNITEKVFIADVSENALENGIKNVKKYDFILSSRFKKFVEPYRI